MQIPDHYGTLGVLSTASADEIKLAYRKLATEHHPDKTSSLGENARAKSAEIFAEAAKAYEIVGNPQKRKQYDEARSRARVTDINETATQVAKEYFSQFKEPQS